MKEKKPSLLSRLLEIAGNHKYLAYVSCVLIIAHRMRTVDGADKIVVLKDGVVAEQGSPAELKKQNGIYHHMMELQLE